MRRWAEPLAVRIVLIAIVLPLVGILAVSAGVLHRMRSAYLHAARSQAEALAEVVVRSVERSMLDGRADLSRRAAADLRGLSGVSGVEILDAQGREAFEPEAPPREREALERLRAGAFSRGAGDVIVFYRPLDNGPECPGVDRSLGGYGR